MTDPEQLKQIAHLDELVGRGIRFSIGFDPSEEVGAPGSFWMLQEDIGQVELNAKRSVLLDVVREFQITEREMAEKIKRFQG